MELCGQSSSAVGYGAAAGLDRLQSLNDALEASVTSSIPQVFTRAEEPFGITFTNRAWQDLCGYSATEVIGRTCKILQGPDTNRDVLQMLHRALHYRLPTKVRLLNYTKQGVPFLNDLTVEPLGDSPDSITHLKGSMRVWSVPDSGTRHQRDAPHAFETPDEWEESQRQLKEMPTFLEDAVMWNKLPLVLTGCTRPFRIEHVNRAWCDLCEYEAHEAIGSTCKILQGSSTSQSTLNALHAAGLKCEAITVKLLNYTKVCCEPPQRMPMAHGYRRVTCRLPFHRIP